MDDLASFCSSCGVDSLHGSWGVDRGSLSNLMNTSLGNGDHGRSVGEDPVDGGSTSEPIGEAIMGKVTQGGGGDQRGHVGVDVRLLHRDGLLVDHRGLDDLLDGVDLVGLGHRHGPGHLDVVGLGHVLGVDDGPLHGHGDGPRDLHGELVDLQLRLDPGQLGGDDGVGPAGGDDALLRHGVQGGRAQVDGGRRDGVGGGRGRQGGVKGHGVLAVGGRGLDHREGRRVVHGLTRLDVLVAHLDGAGPHLDGLAAHDAVPHEGLGHRGTGHYLLMDMCGTAVSVPEVAQG